MANGRPIKRKGSGIPKAKDGGSNPLKFFNAMNEARQKLVKKSMGGPGSGMGRMAADDAAFEAMMTLPKPPPKVMSGKDLRPTKIYEDPKMLLNPTHWAVQSGIPIIQKMDGNIKSKKRK